MLYSEICLNVLYLNGLRFINWIVLNLGNYKNGLLLRYFWEFKIIRVVLDILIYSFYCYK